MGAGTLGSGALGARSGDFLGTSPSPGQPIAGGREPLSWKATARSGGLLPESAAPAPHAGQRDRSAWKDHASIHTTATPALGETEAQAHCRHHRGRHARCGGCSRGWGPRQMLLPWQAWPGLRTAHPPPAHPPGMRPSFPHILFLSFLPGAETGSELAKEPRRKPRASRGLGPVQGCCLHTQPGGHRAPGFLTTLRLAIAPDPPGLRTQWGFRPRKTGWGLVPGANKHHVLSLGAPTMCQKPAQSASRDQPG